MDIPVKSAETPRWERRKEARPSELMDAALELFVEKGFAATRLDDVAKRAGVSKGTLYLYFDSKEDLLKAVVREGYVARIADAEAYARAFTGTSAELLRDIMGMWWTQVGATPMAGITKLMIAEAGNFPELARFYHDEVMHRGMGLFTYALQRGIASGEFRPVNLEHATRLCCAPVVMTMIWKHSLGLCTHDELVPEAYFETHLDMLLRGLRSA
ncbi:MAG: TetR/AcrR family transcriptional regulator [Betaproteobacteria bacterium]|nr:TetR/AcrR family transcriptional regulator [Betaproteobacteria bacterium]